MKYLKDYNIFLEKALYPSQFRPYVAEFDRERYEKLFQEMKAKYDGDRNAYRIFIPLIETDKKGNIERAIEDFLNSREFDIIDYKEGKCKNRNAKNPSKIGQILTRLNRTDLLKYFNEDGARKHGETMVCISRHPYDIAGADTDRRWTNCMTLGTEISPQIKRLLKEHKELTVKLRELQLEKAKLFESDLEKKAKKAKKLELTEKIERVKLERDNVAKYITQRRNTGCNVRYLLQDIKLGSIEAFLIKKTDKNLNDPIADMNIKPYISQANEKDMILVADRNYYGEGTIAFKETVEKWCDEANGEKAGVYELAPGLYDDSNYGYIIKIESADKFIEWIKSGNLNESQISEYFSILRSKNNIPKEDIDRIIDYLMEKGLYDVDEYIQAKGLNIFESVDILIKYKRWKFLINEVLDQAFDAEKTETVIKILTASRKKLHYSYDAGDGWTVMIKFQNEEIEFIRDELTSLEKELYEKDFIRFNNKNSEKRFLKNLEKVIDEDKFNKVLGPHKKPTDPFQQAFGGINEDEVEDEDDDDLVKFA